MSGLFAKKSEEPDSGYPEFDFSDRIDLDFPPPTTRPALEDKDEL